MLTSSLRAPRLRFDDMDPARRALRLLLAAATAVTAFALAPGVPGSPTPTVDAAPDDIVAVYTKRKLQVRPFNVRLDTTGILQLGEYRDPETGFVSMVRIVDATTG